MSLTATHPRLLGEHSESEPPDSIPNSVVKPLSADDSVAGCHVKVGNRQALLLQPDPFRIGFFLPAGKLRAWSGVLCSLFGTVELFVFAGRWHVLHPRMVRSLKSLTLRTGFLLRHVGLNCIF